MQIPDDIAYLAIKLYLENPNGLEPSYRKLVQSVWSNSNSLPTKMRAKDIANVIQRLLRMRNINSTGFNEQSVRKLMMEMVRSNRLLFVPPQNLDEKGKLCSFLNDASDSTESEPPTKRNNVETCRLDQIEVVCSRWPNPDGVTLDVSHVAGDRLLALIEDVARTKPEVHIGFGAGFTSTWVAERVALRLRGLPPLTTLSGDPVTLIIHALSSNFDTRHPRSSPEAKAALFEGLPTPMRFVGLIAEPVLPTAEFEHVIKRPGIREAFARKKEIDIVFTSLAAAPVRMSFESRRIGKTKRESVKSGSEIESQRRTLGLWNEYAQRFSAVLSKDPIAALEQHHWVGDLQFCPFGTSGPIDPKDVGIRAVALYSIFDLFEMARTKHKHVLIAAGPGKALPLYYLLTEPTLRVWTNIVIDVGTSEAIRKLGDSLTKNAARTKTKRTNPK